MEGLQRSNLTAQGVGCPVPAEGGVQAGPRTSIFSDRNASVVANLATVADKATSNTLKEKNDEGTPTGRITSNPFLGSKKTARSPISTPAATSRLALPSATTPVGTPPTESAEMSELRHMGPTTSFEKLGEKIRALSKMLQGRRSIHQPMRDLVDSILGLYTAADEEQSVLPTLPKAHKATSTATPSAAPSDGKRARADREELPSPTSGPKKVKGRQTAKPSASKSPKVPGPKKDVDAVRQPHSQWKKVGKPRGRVKPAKSDAIVVKGDPEMSYADILRSVKTEPKLRSLAQHVKAIRKTAKGELLFELSKSADPHTKTLQDAVKDFLGSKAEVRSLTATTAFEIRDLDEVTTAEEILEALITQFGEIQVSSSSIVSMRKSYGGTQIASLKLPADEAEKLLQAGKLRVGWVICRVRRKVQPMRCLRCIDFGHVATKCREEVDCKGLCFKCGQADHQAKSCKHTPKCLLCIRKGEKEVDHPVNSTRCPYLAKALVRAKSQ
ncbi:hypothetical protein ACLKA7_001770 [Drosophila subpalustris]